MQPKIKIFRIIRLISQLINSISRVSKNYLDVLVVPMFQYFFVPSFPDLPIIFILYLNGRLVSSLTLKSEILPSLFKAG